MFSFHGLPMPSLSPADQAALRAMHRAARNPRLKAAIAAYERLRKSGVDHEEAVERAMECIMKDAPMGRPN